MSRKNDQKNPRAPQEDRHLLYEAAVQSVDFDLDTIEQIYRKARGRPPRLLREDFCGTGHLAGEWIGRHPENRAWGVDLDRATVEWGRHRARQRIDGADRLVLLEGDVLETTTPPVDLVVAFNYSYMVFKERAILRRYFERALASLQPDGLLIVDLFGGTEATSALREERTVKGKRGPDGKKIPRFDYVWEQKRFNPVTHDLLSHIHFEFPDGSRIKKAFTYDWRLWTIPEIRELLVEAGFTGSEIHTHGWDQDGESDDDYRPRQRFTNEDGWLAYVVGYR